MGPNPTSAREVPGARGVAQRGETGSLSATFGRPKKEQSPPVEDEDGRGSTRA